MARLEYLEKTIKPKLPQFAELSKSRLVNVLLSLRIEPAAVLLTNGQDELIPRPVTFDYRRQMHLDAEEEFRKAFLKAFHLKLDMAKCSIHYDFRFPRVEEKFDGNWMEVTQSGEIPQVYICLRPAIVSINQRGARYSEKIVSKAIVMLDGGAPTN